MPSISAIRCAASPSRSHPRRAGPPNARAGASGSASRELCTSASRARPRVRPGRADEHEQRAPDAVVDVGCGRREGDDGAARPGHGGRDRGPWRGRRRARAVGEQHEDRVVGGHEPWELGDELRGRLLEQAAGVELACDAYGVVLRGGFARRRARRGRARTRAGCRRPRRLRRRSSASTQAAAGARRSAVRSGSRRRGR